MRVVLLISYLILTILISFKDWYKGLCFAIPILAVLERRDIPRGLFNIDGLNPYNILLVFVLFSFFIRREKEPLNLTLDPLIKKLLIAYIILFFIAFLRILFRQQDLADFYDSRNIPIPSLLDLTKDEFINRVKWLVPGALMIYGCNSQARMKMGLSSMLSTGVLLSLQVISRMLPTLIEGEDLGDRALRVLDQTIGYHRTDLGGVLAGFAWVSLCLRGLSESRLARTMCYGAFVACTVALFLTGSRAGYGAWALCGTILIVIRWKKLILIGPPAALLIIISVPGVMERMTVGFTEETYSNHALKGDDLGTIDDSGRDLYQITSGRIVLWQVVFKEIRAAPIFGHGILGFRSQAINLQLNQEESGAAISNVGHSHSAFLDLIVDGGFVSFIVVMLLYFLIMNKARKMFASKSATPMDIAISGTAISMVVSQLIGYSAQGTFWPHQVATFMYCSIAILIFYKSPKVSVQEVQPEKADIVPKTIPLWSRSRI
jgi:O-antigen ligase